MIEIIHPKHSLARMCDQSDKRVLSAYGFIDSGQFVEVEPSQISAVVWASSLVTQFGEVPVIANYSPIDEMSPYCKDWFGGFVRSDLLGFTAGRTGSRFNATAALDAAIHGPAKLLGEGGIGCDGLSQEFSGLFAGQVELIIAPELNDLAPGHYG